MFWSKAYIPTLKDAPEKAESSSHKLMLRAGLVRMLIAGVYLYLPFGLKVLNKIQKIIRQEMDSSGAQELLLSCLQPQELWIRSGRDKQMEETMIKFTDRKSRRLCLGPTHEEVITDLLKNYIQSYRQLPLVVYQIQTKFRDELRPRFGLVRACEFIMKDAYSFDQDQAGLNKNYKIMLEAYSRIFKRCGLSCIVIEADPGVMGGNLSHEFMVPSENGEDTILLCPNCGNAKNLQGDLKNLQEQSKRCPQCNTELILKEAIEVGHIFQLGTKYSQTFGAYFLDNSGKRQPIIMGCYGIGVSRLISAIIEQNYDKEGIIWPHEVAPYQVLILPIDSQDKKISNLSLKIYEDLKKEGIEVIFDDRDESAGVKFKDADLIGIPLRVIISKELIKKGSIEIKIRKSQKIITIKKKDVVREVKRRIKTANFCPTD